MLYRVCRFYKYIQAKSIFTQLHRSRPSPGPTAPRWPGLNERQAVLVVRHRQEVRTHAFSDPCRDCSFVPWADGAGNAFFPLFPILIEAASERHTLTPFRALLFEGATSDSCAQALSYHVTLHAWKYTFRHLEKRRKLQ